MFLTIKRFLEDLRSSYYADPNVASLGDDDKSGMYSRIRVFVQLGLTALMIGLCAIVITRPESSDTTVKLAHTGFGIVMGYWFR